MRFTSVKQFVAIKPLHFSKVEAKVQSGIATIAQKRDVVQVDLVMDCDYEGKTYRVGTNKVILHGDAALKPWNKHTLSLDGQEFVLCPVAEVVGFVGPDFQWNPLTYPIPAPPYNPTLTPPFTPPPPFTFTVTSNGTDSIILDNGNGISYEGLK